MENRKRRSSQSSINLSIDEFNLNDHMINSFFSHSKAEDAKLKLLLFKKEQRKKDFLIVKNISEDIYFEDEDVYNNNKKLNNGSLYELFTNKYFDINFLLNYIDKYENQGIFDSLINVVYERFIDDSVFFLPQLWYNFYLFKLFFFLIQ